MKAAKVWDSREGSPTVVLVTDDDQLYVHGNLGWMGPVNHDGGTALETGQALADAWGLQECDDERAQSYIEPNEPDE